MNSQQTKYALERAAAIKARLVAEAIKLHTTPKHLLTVDEKVLALARGLIKFDEERPHDTQDTVLLAPVIEAIGYLYTKTCDLIVLGDAAEAALLLESFNTGTLAILKETPPA